MFASVFQKVNTDVEMCQAEKLSLPSRKAGCLFIFTENVPGVFLFNFLECVLPSQSEQVAK